MSRRALFVSHSYYLRDTRLRRHAEALAAERWDVEVLCARDAGERRRQRVNGVRIRRLPSRRRRGSKARYVFEYLTFMLLATSAVVWRALRHRYALCYVLSLPNILVVAGLPARWRGARLILDVRDPMPEFFSSKYPDARLAKVLRVEERLACRIASTVVTVSPVMADLLTRTGVDRDAIGVVMNVPDPAIFGDAGDAVRAPQDRTILYTGTVATRYGVDLLPTAVARLRDEIPGLRLRVVGDGDAMALVASIAAAEGISNLVQLEGPQPLESIPRIAREAWMGVQVHREDALMRYCLSTKVLEWCAVGLPAIVGRTPALESILREDEVAFVEPGDLEGLCAALRAAHDDAAALASRGMRAREATRRFDWAHERSTLLEIVERRDQGRRHGS